MSGLKIDGSGMGGLLPAKSGEKGPGQKGFDELMQHAINEISRIQTETENATKELASGGDITHAVIAMEKADVNFQVMIQVRNKLLSAYEEIMRMQI
ncbi:MAG: flagellar hook-basal body complex protein FliE [Nitrospiraceae bacterium]|nr:flagellar hook-basal body complex protein FliE [Nitrospiraceae bacterium]